MKQKRNKKKNKWGWMLTLTVMSLLVIAVTMVFIRAEEPPIKEIENAKTALVAAGSIHAEKYSSDLVNQAKNYYDLAISNWTAQNQEWFFQRDFSAASADFQAVLQLHPADAVTKLFLEKSKYCLQYGIDTDWTGLEKMGGK